MTVLSEEGSDRKSYTKDRNNIKMLIISLNLKLVQWTFGQELDIDKRNFFLNGWRNLRSGRHVIRKFHLT